MWRVFGWAMSWIVRGVVVKSVVLSGVFALVLFLVPYAVNQLISFINPSLLTNAFAALPPGVWYFLDAFRLDVGAPLVISAFVAHFIIRRLPVIG